MLKKILLLWLLGTVSALAQTGAVQGHSFVGGTPSVTSGLKSANYLDGIIPHATITVYFTGTTNLVPGSQIFSNSTGTVLGNPFTSNDISSLNPGGWLFFAAQGQGYDVVGSGGLSPNTYGAPTPLCTDCFASGGGGGGSGCSTQGVAGTLNVSDGSGGCILSNADYGATDPDGFTLGQVQGTTVTNAACDGTNCTITAPNSYAASQAIQIGDGFAASCLTDSGLAHVLSAGLSTSQFEVLESETGCTGTVAGASGGSTTSDFTDLNVNAGSGVINLIALNANAGPVAAGYLNAEAGQVLVLADQSSDSVVNLQATGEDGIWLCTSSTGGPECPSDSTNGSISIDSGNTLYETAPSYDQIYSGGGFYVNDTSVSSGWHIDTSGTGTGSLAANAIALYALADTDVTINSEIVCTASNGECPGAGVSSINANTGAFTFSFSAGAGSCSGTTCTFTGSGSGGGSVTNFIASSGSWPTWLVPSVATSTTTPTLSVSASAIPNSALANVSTTVNGQTCTLGSSCTISGTQTLCSGTITLSGTLSSSTTAPVGTATCTGLTTADVVIATFQGNIFSLGGFIPSTNGILSVAVQVSANTITINAENNTTLSQTIGSGVVVNFKVIR